MILGALLAIVLAGAGYGAYAAFFAGDSQTEEPELQTTVVREGDLVLYASGSGTLIAGEEIELGFGTGGTVAELYVAAGDVVTAGDVLAVQADQEELEATVASDQLAVIDAQEALDALYEDAELAAAQAQLDLANAQDVLEDAQRTWQYQQEGYRASSVTITAAKAELSLAESEMSRAEKRAHACGSSSDPDCAQAYKNYAAAVQSYWSALANVNWYTGHPTETQQALLDADVALAQAELDAALREYERIAEGPDPNDVTKLELQLAKAEKDLALSQRNLEDSVLVAPTDGTILTVTAEEGENVSGAFITMADLSDLYMEVFLDETDLDNVKQGYEIEVVFDALPDSIFGGEIIQVDPSLYTSGMISAIRALASLDTSEQAEAGTLLIGMNATVDVIGGRAEGVALLPVEALRELSAGEYAVFVMENDKPRLTPVEVGLMDLSFAEIKSGVEVGDVVTTGIVDTG